MFIAINPTNIDNRLIQQAVKAMRSGELIIFPTDTVYAVGCDVKNKKGLVELAKWKGVKLNAANFSMICNDLSQVSEYVKHLDRPSYRLLKHSLPGPFTFILAATNDVSKLFGATKKEIGIRIPANEIALALVTELGNPMASTSLHDSEDEITDYFIEPASIYERYDEEVAMIIDGGMGSLEVSTIVNLTDGVPQIIRQGHGIIEL
jgi:tRNA threonylcarbamoyl adenosine modification protein (Sua5/YciO/YrdC/YwlC family)